MVQNFAKLPPDLLFLQNECVIVGPQLIATPHMQTYNKGCRTEEVSARGGRTRLN